uniref:Uncharacterized protein n=1 Tax=Romanomermis culicivorax TaxID=13658 RepID=A0A915JJ00_ROMCU
MHAPNENTVFKCFSIQLDLITIKILITITTHRPKSSEKFMPSLNFPPTTAKRTAPVTEFALFNPMKLKSESGVFATHNF